MLVGNQEITKENMPSYNSPEQQPYHKYQMMQDTIMQGLMKQQGMGAGGVQMQQQNSMDNRQNAWNNNNEQR